MLQASPCCRLSRLALATLGIAGFSLAAAAPGAADEPSLGSAGPLPEVHLGDYRIFAQQGLVAIEARVRNFEAADGLQFLLKYDSALLQFSSVEQGAWAIQQAQFDEEGQIKLRWKRPTSWPGPELEEETGGAAATKGTLIGTMFFSTVPRANDEVVTALRHQALIRLDRKNLRGGSYFYAASGSAGSTTIVPSQLTDATVTVYHRSGLELGWGEITRTAQTFRLPLYMTRVEDGAVPPLSGGIDYDELFLRVAEIEGLTPPLTTKHIPLRTSAGPSEGQERAPRTRFELRFDLDVRGPFLRQHIANVVLTYLGQADGGGEEVGGEEAGTALGLLPALLEADGTRPEGDDMLGAGVGLEGLEGENSSQLRDDPHAFVRVLPLDPAYFVRGNVTSEPGAGDLTSVRRILNALFLGGTRLPCEQAADVDGSGVIELTDAVLLLNSLFNDGPDPAQPYPQPDFAPAPSPLSCEEPFPFFQPVLETDVLRSSE